MTLPLHIYTVFMVPTYVISKITNFTFWPYNSGSFVLFNLIIHNQQQTLKSDNN